MTNGWHVGKFGDVLEPVSRPVQVEADKVYRNLGVQWYAYGLFVREEKPGHEIRAKELYQVELGDLVYNRLFAWKGSFAIADKDTAGGFVSGEFPCFRVDTERANAKYLHLYLSQEKIWEEIERTSTGQTSISRLRLKEPIFLGMEIPLPPLDEQHRIVERVEALATRIAKAQSLREETSREVNIILASIKNELFSIDGNTTVKDYATVQSGYAFKSEWFTGEGIRLVRNVNIGHGEIRWNDTARISFDRQNDFPAFELHEGDVLISLDRPLISSGLKATKVRKQDLPSLLLQRVGRVVFKNGKVLPDYFYQWLNSPSFVSSIDPGRSNGVPHISPKDVEKITFAPPSLDEQRRVIAYLDGLQMKVNTLRELQSASGEELSALMPSILDKAFKGNL